MSTMYASFADPAAAERAAGALLDQGASSTDISIVANEAYNSTRAVVANASAADAEASAKQGISTTTASDVAVGAVKGGTLGLGIGIAAALATVFIPGLGLVLGGGALSMALAAGFATGVAGAAAGSVVGYLKDQGIPEEMITRYSKDFASGGAILAIAVPTGTLLNGEIEGILTKYGALNIATYNTAHVLIDDPAVQIPRVPLEIDNPRIDPIAAAPAAAVVQGAPATHTVVDASTGEARVVTQVEPTMIDPVTGVASEAVAMDPLTQVERPVAVETPVYPTTRPVTAVTVDPLTGLPITPVPATPINAPAVVEAVQPRAVTRVEKEVTPEGTVQRTETVQPAPATVVETTASTGVVYDPVTGLERPATPAEGLAGEAIAPVQTDTVIAEEEPIVVDKRDDVNLY